MKPSLQTTRPNRHRNLFAAFLASCIIGIAPYTHGADRTWGGADGAEWTTSENWLEGAYPTSDDRAIFRQGSGDQTVVISDSAQALSLQVARGQNLTLVLEGAGTLKTTDQNNIGAPYTGTSGAASLTIRRAPDSTGTVKLALSRIFIGSDDSSADGNALHITGAGLIVDTTGNPTGQLVVGARRANNSATISDGAQLIVKNIVVSQSSSITGNRIEITGQDSLLRANDTVLIGSNTTAQTYQAAPNNNFLRIADGGTFQFNSSSTNNLSTKVGAVQWAHSNYILVEGENSAFKTNRIIQIGDAASLNAGGNRIELRDNGALQTSADVLVYGQRTEGAENDGSNRIVIGRTAAFTQTAGTLEINRGALLQLEEDGVLSGTNIKIKGGRFEAAGSGLITSGVTEIGPDGVLAIGLQGATAPSALTVSSAIQFMSSSLLELQIFDQGEIDHIIFQNGGHFLVGEGATLRITLNGYSVKAGDSWTPFSGVVANIDNAFSSFELPTIEAGLSWDTSLFNLENGWQLKVIPEPSVTHSAWLVTLVLIAGSGGRRFLARASGRSI